MTDLIIRSRSDCLRDAENKLAAALRAAQCALTDNNLPTAEFYFNKAEALRAWIKELKS